MMQAPPTNTRNEHRLSWLFTGSAGARLSTSISSAMHPQKHFAAPAIVPAARPNRHSGALILARPKKLPALRLTCTPEPAAKSP